MSLFVALVRLPFLKFISCFTCFSAALNSSSVLLHSQRLQFFVRVTLALCFWNLQQMSMKFHFNTLVIKRGSLVHQPACSGRFGPNVRPTYESKYADLKQTEVSIKLARRWLSKTKVNIVLVLLLQNLFIWETLHYFCAKHFFVT